MEIAQVRLYCSEVFDCGFWINLQSRYDLAVVEQNIGAKIIVEVEQAVA